MIHYKNVSKYFYNMSVLDKINMEIEDGEFVILLGERGGGKTTTIKMINKLISQSDCVIKINEDVLIRYNRTKTKNGICNSANRRKWLTWIQK